MAVADGDWREFRELRDRARRRFFDGTLAQVMAIALNEEDEDTARVHALERLMKQHEQQRRALFEDFDRAHLVLMLHVMLNQGLLERDELTGLSLGLRRALGLIG